MRDPHVPEQLRHVPGLKNVPNQTAAFPEIKTPAFTSHDPRGVLPAMLKHGQRFIQFVLYGMIGNYACNSTHG
jgi:hypothetical protein